MARRGSSRKYYRLMKGNREMAVFTGRQPRQAALKAATRGHTEIRLRERGRRNRDGTYTIHVFKGSRKKVTLPQENRVSWLPSQVWKPSVRKSGIERVKSLRRR
ncbi:MAG: chromosomal protein MC1 [Candidatus Aenigmarchaeota archaeon]|nr:chromosomal protein MC1 [Candidatus Aenigmarchaeota archaeon]